jgi:ABC-type multidrug transport system fused ATPase/permease subunit
MLNKKNITSNQSWFDIIKFTWSFLEGMKLRYVVWTVFIIIAYLAELLPPLVVGYTIDFFTSYTTGDSLNTFYLVIFAYGFGHILNSLLRLQAKYELSKIATSITYKVKVQGFEKLMQFSLKWHDKENSGNKIQRIIAGSDALRNITKMLHSHAGILLTIISLIGTLSIFLLLDLKFMIFAFGYLLSFFFIEYIFYKISYPQFLKLNILTEKSSGKYFESSSNVLTIKTLGVQDTLKQTIDNAEIDVKNAKNKIDWLGTTKWKFFQLLHGISIIIFFLLILNGINTNTQTVGMIATYLVYFEKIKRGASDMTDIIFQLSELKSKVVRMLPIFMIQEIISNGNNGFPINWNNIKLKSATFSYKNQDKQGIYDVSMNIQKNQKIGIVGHSGSGKSTLAKILLGLHKLDSGLYKIGETNFYKIKNTAISENIAIVLQEVELFNLSFKDNIQLMRNIDNSLFIKALYISQLDDVIAKLPEGIDTIIGEKGYRLSGGERQRIGIARAICKDAPILVLDEATSSLDSNTEKKIQLHLQKELGDKTIISIAHRLSTLENVDIIYVFESGRIVEQGNFQDLIADKNSKFFEMYKVQTTKNII